ncbi:hypothetical protein ACFU99_19460 [Streptomyces sp. NPDC057654]|uniref:hypothetical protein n=1 Tax=Streptomyces sp. NPDC057654 TaxID=3346196 RepID=UPI0036AB6946
MSDERADGTEDVVGVLTARIEAQYRMGIDQLKAAAATAPEATPGAAGLLAWHGLLIESEAALERAEDALLAALEAQPGEVDDPTMDLAHRVNEAVAVRDGRALIVRWLLDPQTPSTGDADRFGRAAGRGPAVQTSVARPPAPAPGPAPRTGRAAQR